MCKEIKLAAEGFGIKLVCKLLCFRNVTDLVKRIIIHLVRDPVFIENMLHHFTSIDVDLDKERKPCLQFHMHEAKMLIQVI